MRSNAARMGRSSFGQSIEGTRSSKTSMGKWGWFFSESQLDPQQLPQVSVDSVLTGWALDIG
ncbi:hypothetical protein [Accumulibacter sp.]|uniref:hypothetical protein n=1 Tax=Accumulibacter sp. TaxID=2053492 RepID=UPI002CB5D0A3|nr:hypothetical protein [Accumulibacter sp.]HNC22112.1 hypothetical protein [Accumulibacter sp.]